MAAVCDIPWIESYASVVPTEHLPVANRTTLFELISALQDLLPRVVDARRAVLAIMPCTCRRKPTFGLRPSSRLSDPPSTPQRPNASTSTTW
jgi:hypothetical protein